MFSVRFFLACGVLIIAVNGTEYEEFKTVNARNGPIRGILKTTIRNVPYYSFKGIPYAKPPIGDLRFKAPKQVGAWKVAFDAFEHGKICVQPNTIFREPSDQSEDCLTLNIYVPADVKPDEKLAVLFFIHGGGFAEGSGNDHILGPDFIIEKQTILVTVNYRLGLLGFLSLDSKEYSGNMGLKDQQLALKWVHSNIGRFGGDNKRITIFGQSAGGASVHFHILSAESRKYFHNAIPMSGSVNNYWAMSENNNHVEIAYQIARDLEQPKNTYQELVDFLKLVPSDIFNDYSALADAPTVLFNILLTPVIERKDAIQPFIVDSPEKIYETTEINVDTLFTMTSLESIGLFMMVPPLSDSLFNNLSLPFRGLQIPLGSNEHRILTDEIRNFYFGNDLKNDQAMKKYVELSSDVNFGYAIDKSVRTNAAKSKGKTYYSWFSVVSKLNLSVIIPQNPAVANIQGASHCDDLFHLFRANAAQSIYDDILNNKDDEKSKIAIQAIENISTLFTNFAKYGTPSHNGDPIEGIQPVQDDEVHFIDINNDGITTGLWPNRKAVKFWENIEQKAIKLSADIKQQKRDEL